MSVGDKTAAVGVSPPEYLWDMLATTSSGPTPGVLDLQLLLVRSLLDRARSAARDHTSVGVATGLLLADVAVETITKTACRHVNVGPQRHNASLRDYLDALEGAKPSVKGAHEIVAVEKLRKNRNPVQHEGTIPDAGLVLASINDAEAFCILLASEVWGRSFGAISTAQLVRDRTIRALIDAAIAARDEADLRRALVLGLAAFDYLHFTWSRAVRLADGYDESRDAFRAGVASAFLRAVGINIYMPKPDDEHQQAYPILARMTLGLPVDELVRVQRLEMIGHTILDKKRTRVAREDVDFLVNAVSTACWRLESHHPGVLDIDPVVVPPSRRKGKR